MDRATDRLRADALAAYTAAVDAVEPKAATSRALAAVGNDLAGCSRVLVVAVGKAAQPMACACSEMGGGFVLSPHAVVGDPERLAGFECLVGGHPTPTREGFAASRRILEAVGWLGARDGLLFALSGGASSLFEVPVPALSDADAIAVYEALVRSGLAIAEINAVRGALSMVKAGRLAIAARPARVLTLAISDVVGDDPAVIGSAPTVASQVSVEAARRILSTVAMDESLRARAISALARPAAQATAGTYRIAACARDAVAAARSSLETAGYRSVEPPLDPLLGDAGRAAHLLAVAIRERARAHGPWCMTIGGESTVALPRDAGDGGRNRHLACTVAELLDGVEGFALLAAGTDGVDGSTSAAGGLVDGGSAARMRAAGLDVAESLSRFDSGTALAAAGDAVVTGASATNVGDVLVALGPGSAPIRDASR